MVTKDDSETSGSYNKPDEELLGAVNPEDAQFVATAFGKLARCIRDVVRKKRESLGLTQQELASRAGFTANYIERLESDPHDVSLDNLRRLAKSLEITSWDLLKEAEELLDTSGHRGE